MSSSQELYVESDEITIARLMERESLEGLGAAYWRHVRRSTLGLASESTDRSQHKVVIAGYGPSLLAFGSPEITQSDDRSAISWPITGGLLLARDGCDQGCLCFAIEQVASNLVRLSAEVNNYHPRLKGRGRFGSVGERIYEATQLRVHRWVTNSFLRSVRDRIPAADSVKS